jgi:cytochrome b561
MQAAFAFMHMAHSGTSLAAAQRYSRITVVLHWVLAAALLVQVVLGWWMLELPKSPAGLRAGWFNVHKSIGLTLALLIVLRLAWRTTHGAPAADTGTWQRAAAQAVHGMLYACMLLLPVCGFLGSSFTRYPVRWFGWVVPTPHTDWPAAKQLMSDLHYAAAWALVVLVAVHVAAAAWHWVRRDDVPARMGIPSLP